MNTGTAINAAAAPPYPRLLSPLTVTDPRGAAVELRCRVLMGSMHTGLEELPDGFERMAAFYAARARGGTALIVTGGLSPNAEGNMWDGMRTLDSARDLAGHRRITQAVHAQGGLIAMQLLHAGRYARHAQGVAPSALRSPISPATPREMSEADIQRTLDDYARAAALAQEAGYDGVEVMGAEGYLINQFAAPRSNQRTDAWGGSAENRMRFAIEAVRRVHAATRPGFLLIVRLSMLDLVEGGSTWDEVVQLARAVQDAGASILNPYVGWHEARIPTIASTVPQAAFVDLTARLKRELRIPVVASNRINDPALAESILARGDADLISMARPLLADADFVRKAREGRADHINTCIACNQGCLDEAFSGRLTGCLVNPQACRETELALRPATRARRIAVVGGGPGGLACATAAAELGHRVTLFEGSASLGGQFRLAQRIPGKAEYAATVRQFEARLRAAGAQLRLGVAPTAAQLQAGGFDHVVVATGVRPRALPIPGSDHPSVIGYEDLIAGRRQAGGRVAVVGAGGIGFDVAALLTHAEPPGADAVQQFRALWGIQAEARERGGLVAPAPLAPGREVWLLQRKDETPGRALGKTTGWIHKALLARRGVHLLGGVQYERIDDAGLHIRVRGEPRTLAVDSIVACVGQEPRRELFHALLALGVPATCIGGAREAQGLDAARAMDEAVRLAASWS